MERADALALMREHNLDIRDFVLFVSTIEPRKNHALALSTWSRMVKMGRCVPMLVCVGATGWYNESFHQTIARDVGLADNVLVLTDIPDQLLRLLYERCLFTIYPSRYEGWGLPVSEALGHGKVPLVSRASSLPEAGGELAEYFDLDSEADFQAKLERLIDDAPYRTEKESKIVEAPNLRSWTDIARQVLNVATSMKERLEEPRPPTIIRGGVYYTFGRNQAMRIADLQHSGEVFRDTLAWHSPEVFGCWTSGAADIAIKLAEEGGEEFYLYLCLIGTATDNTVTLSVPSAGWSTKVEMRAHCQVWERIAVRFAPESTRREMRIRLSSDTLDDFAARTDGSDLRKAAVGVKGIYICRSDDAAGRLSILEAIATDDLQSISWRRPKQVVV